MVFPVYAEIPSYEFMGESNNSMIMDEIDLPDKLINYIFTGYFSIITDIIDSSTQYSYQGLFENPLLTLNISFNKVMQPIRDC